MIFVGIETQSISAQIFEIIKEKILLQEFRLGEKINTRKISEKYDISMMPVRDALKELENRGLVINKERVGFFVKEFSPKEIKEIIEVRKMYEVYCLEKFSENIDEVKLKELLCEMNKFENRSRAEFDKIDKSFHELIINASNNDFLTNKYSEMEDIIDLVRHLDKDREDQSMNEHILVCQNILNNDTVKAKNELENHINNVRNAIISEYKKINNLYKEEDA